MYIRLAAEEPALASLVLMAVDIPHWIDTEKNEIVVREQDRPLAEAQLQAFVEENRNWPPPETASPVTGQPPTRSLIFLFGSLAIFFQITGPWQDNNPWFSLGAVDRNRILQEGEWWRLVTGLTLHTDYGHLIANCLVGWAILYFLCQSAGYGVGWLTVILAGTAGNLLNIVFRNGGHLSVGFSTAVFAAIGTLSGCQLLDKRPYRLQRLLLALGAGLGLLALLGTEGKQTDLGAHLFGFCCGLTTGLALCSIPLSQIRERKILQLTLLATALALIIVSWLAAWSTMQ